MKWTLITGASAGIGAEMAHLFAARGHNLVLVARRDAALRALQETLQSRHKIQVETRAFDLSRVGAASKLQSSLPDFEVEILVNNAGFGLAGPFLQLEGHEQEQIIQLNVTALVDLCYVFGKEMKTRASGRILNVSSLAAFQSGPYSSVYYASKAFVQSFSEALAEELRGSGVTVTTLCPGPTPTEFQARAGVKAALPSGLVVEAQTVARCGVEAVLAGRGTVFPVPRLAIIGNLSRMLPRSFTTRVAGWLARKRLRT